jgi:hypothetical protein
LEEGKGGRLGCIQLVACELLLVLGVICGWPVEDHEATGLF